MVKVNVWLASRTNSGKNVGHTSLDVNGTYISWWPNTNAGPLGKYYPRSHKNLDDDCHAEGHNPDHVIILTKLDENKIIRWWLNFGVAAIPGNDIQGPPLPYSMLDYNCSMVVATALKVGGGDLFASRFSSYSILWRPQTVLEFANSIKAGAKQ